MNANKIIGFCITKENNICKESIDLFKSDLNFYEFSWNNYFISIWGIGNICKCLVNNKFSLSFPLHESLLDRNILLSVNQDEIIIENDWLGSIPIFYNLDNNIVSTLCLLNKSDNIVDQEGLFNFLEFGYSVFENTIFKNVKFLRYYSKIILTVDDIKIIYKDDFTLISEIRNNVPGNEEHVLSLIRKYIWDVEEKIDGKILIPTSGGYDSRMLNFFVKDKSRIRSFTYGISKKQSESYEVIKAKELSKILNTKWDQIELNNFFQFVGSWFKLYGFSTHLHGMYHIEFYHKIKEQLKEPVSLLSGVVGDAWAGSINLGQILDEKDIKKLSYSHGIYFNSEFIKLVPEEITAYKKFYEENRDFLNSSELMTIYIIRIKIILLSYLYQIPEYFGIPTWTPFLNFSIVKNMLKIDPKRRNNRVWQKDFFKKIGLDIESKKLKFKSENSLDSNIAKIANLEVLDTKILEPYVDPKHLIHINNVLIKWKNYYYYKNVLFKYSLFQFIFRKLSIKNEYKTYLNEYFVIKVLERSLKYGN